MAGCRVSPYDKGFEMARPKWCTTAGYRGTCSKLQTWQSLEVPSTRVLQRQQTDFLGDIKLPSSTFYTQLTTIFEAMFR